MPVVPSPTGITAFVGLNGSGKGLAMVECMVLPAIRQGRTVMSNFRIFASADDSDRLPEERKLHPLYRPLRSWHDLDDPDLHNPRTPGCTILLDEISSMFDSRESGKMPVQVVSRMQQLRKGDNFVAWASPDWDRCDKAIRRVTKSLWLCTGHRPERVPGRQWASNRVFKWRYFDAAKFDEFSMAAFLTGGVGAGIKPEYRMRYRRNRHQTQHLYDTYETVSLLDHLDEYGTCINCGGHRRRPACSCARDE